jgi:hypothetical protein
VAPAPIAVGGGRFPVFGATGIGVNSPGTGVAVGDTTGELSGGGVFVGVNKAVGKHHWEVFQDEGRDSRINELITSTLRSQTEAAGDFDIEWAQDTRGHPWMAENIQDFRTWLQHNGFDPKDPTLTIGHPQVGQVDIKRSFGTQDFHTVWARLAQSLDVRSIETSQAACEYPYHWKDIDYIDFMIGEKNEVDKKQKQVLQDDYDGAIEFLESPITENFFVDFFF